MPKALNSGFAGARPWAPAPAGPAPPAGVDNLIPLGREVYWRVASGGGLGGVFHLEELATVAHLDHRPLWQRDGGPTGRAPAEGSGPCPRLAEEAPSKT